MIWKSIKRRIGYKIWNSYLFDLIGKALPFIELQFTPYIEFVMKTLKWKRNYFKAIIDWKKVFSGMFWMNGTNDVLIYRCQRTSFIWITKPFVCNLYLIFNFSKDIERKVRQTLRRFQCSSNEKSYQKINKKSIEFIEDMS